MPLRKQRSHQPHAILRRAASMRPQRCRCGNGQYGVRAGPLLPCFNEAAALPLRKPSCSTREERTHGGFNEAAALPLRKLDLDDLLIGERDASMRPQRCRCGNPSESPGCRYCGSSFNEAAALPLRKRIRRRCLRTSQRRFNEAAALPLRKLQRDADPAAVYDLASMRPQRCRCGNLRPVRQGLSRAHGFNEAAALPLRKPGRHPLAVSHRCRFNEAAALPLRKP